MENDMRSQKEAEYHETTLCSDCLFAANPIDLMLGVMLVYPDLFEQAE